MIIQLTRKPATSRQHPLSVGSPRRRQHRKHI